MNKIYKVVWSRAKNCYVVVSEYAKRQTKSAQTKKIFAALMAAGIMASGAGMASAEGTTVSGVIVQTLKDGEGQDIPNTYNTNKELTGLLIDQVTYSLAVTHDANGNLISSDAGGVGATNKESIALGKGAKSFADQSVSIGVGAMAGGSDTGTGSHNVAIGTEAGATGNNTVSIGHSANAGGEKSIAIGNAARAATGSVAIGGSGTNASNSAIAIGSGDKAATATNETSIAIGSGSAAAAKNSIVIGTDAGGNAEDTIVIGHNAASATGADKGSVALGSDSVTDAGRLGRTDPGYYPAYSVTAIQAGTTTEAKVNATGQYQNVYVWDSDKNKMVVKYDASSSVWSATHGSVSVGAYGLDGTEKTRQITHVAAGSQLTDAVNVAQLVQLKQYVDDSNTKSGKTDYSLVGNPDAENGEYTVGSDGKVTLTVTDGAGVSTSDRTVTIGGITSKAYVDELDKGNVKYDTTTKDGDTVINYDSVTMGNGKGTEYTRTVNAETKAVTYAGGTKITNVAYAADNEGSAAVNVDKLKDYVAENGYSWDLRIKGSGEKTVTNDAKVVFGSTDSNIVVDDNALGDDDSKNLHVSVGLSSQVTIGEVEERNSNYKPTKYKDGAVSIDGKKGYITGLKNITWDGTNYTSGRAATEDQLHAVSANVAKAKTEVTAGDNVTVTTDTTSAADGHTIYKVSAKDTTLDSAKNENGTVTITDTSGKSVTFTDSDTKYTGGDSITINNDNSITVNEGGVNIAYTANGGDKKTVSLANGLNFVQGGATTVTAGADGQITISSTDNYVTSGTYDSTTKKINFVNTDTNKNFEVDLSGIASGISTTDRSLIKGTAHISGEAGTASEVTGYKVENGQIKLQVKDRNTEGATAEEVIIDDVASKTSVDELANATVTGGTINTDGTISLTKKDASKVTLTGKVSDYSVTSGSIAKGTDGKNVLTLVETNAFGGDSKSVTISGIASESDVAAAKTVVKAGTNVTVATDTTAADGHTEYTISATDTTLKGASKDGNTVTIEDTAGNKVIFTDSDTKYTSSDSITINNDNSITVNEGGVNIAYTANGGDKKTVSLANGLNFVQGGATTVTAGDNGAITISSTDTNNYVTSGSVTTEGEGDSQKTYITLKREGLGDVKIDVSGLDTGSGASGKWTLKTFKNADDTTGTTATINSDDTVSMTGENGVEVTSTAGENGGSSVKIGLGNEITVGKDGKDGKDGAAGSIGIAGKDGTKGEDGKDGYYTTVIKTEYVKGTDGIPGIDGKDGVDGITRIIYDGKDGSHTVATLDDGLNFAGDDANVKIGKKLNETLQIKGGADSAKLTDGNIGVVVEDGVMKVKLSSEITGITKLETVNNYEVNNDNSVTNKKYVDNLFKKADGNHTAITVNGESAPADGSYTSGNLQLKKTTEDGKDTYDVKLADDLTLGDNGSDEFVTISGSKGTIWASHSIAAGNVIMDGDSGMISGLSNTTTKYQGFADGSGKAATEEQLKEAMDQAKADAAAADTHVKAGEYSVDKDGKVSMDIVDKDGNSKGTVTITDVAKASDVGDVTKIKEDLQNKDGTKTTVVDAVNNLDTKVNNIDNRVTKIEETAGKHSSVSTEDANLSIDDKSKNAAGGTDYKISLAKDLKVDSVTAGEKTKIDKDGVSYDGKNYIGKDGLNANSQKITNVKDGDVSKDSTDAVNGSQLYETNQNVTNNTIAINNISGSVNKLSNRINRVGAGAAALAALHPLDFDPDAKWDFAAGYGNYRGANAAAVGAYYRPNEDLMFSVGASMGGGENMVNAGISVKLGSGSSHVSTSRVAMAKEIQALREHVAQQDKLIAKMAQGDAISERDLQSTMQNLFPDVPENHWAYDYVEKLGKAGLVEGYPDGEYKGDRMLTRYEFAAVIYRAMQLGVSRIPELSEDGTLSKLVNEFGPELKYIRVDTVKADKNGDPEIQRVRTVKENIHK